MTSFKFYFGLLIVSTMGLGTAQPSRAEVVTSGYLVIDGQEIKPPFDVRIVGDSVTVNGLQVYPYIMTANEIKEDGSRKEAQALLRSMHERFFVKKSSEGYPAAMSWLREQLKYSKYPNAVIKESPRGPTVSLNGKFLEDEYAYTAVFADDIVSSRREEKRRRVARWQRAKAVAESKGGKEAGLDALERALKDDDWVAEFEIDRDDGSYYYLWKDGGGRFYMFGAAPSSIGSKDSLSRKESPSQEQSRRLDYEAQKIVEALKYDGCLIVIGGSVSEFSSKKRNSACEDFLGFLRGNLSKGQALPALRARFPIDYARFWRDIERYREIK